MEKGNTKRAILDAAIDLFSTQGYEATSISQIAGAVGIRKASLYNHFASKQEILDSLLNEALEMYDRHSIFANADWNDPAFTKEMQNITPDMVVEMSQKQVRFVLHDPIISKGRKMLTIEQYQNAKIAAIQTKQNYTDVLAYFEGFMRFLIREGKLKGEDAEIMAAQFCFPITVWLGLCDREPEREEEIMTLIDRHVRRFFQIYRGDNATVL